MASTIVASTLTVTLTEAITLNGVDQGGTQTLTIGTVGEFMKQIIGVTDALTELVSFGALAGKGQTIVSSTKYARFTNKDNTHNLILNVINSDSDEFHMVVKPGYSFIVSTPSSSMDASTVLISSTSMGDITMIKGKSGSAGEIVDVEFVLAQT